MTIQQQEVQIARLQEAVKTLADKLAVTTDAIEALQDERNRALKWGIMSLGSAVLAMGYWIFNQITGGHIK